MTDHDNDRFMLIRWGDKEVRRVEPGSIVRIGRHSSNDIVVGNSGASRFHARITWNRNASRPSVKDLDSQNGTYIDGENLRQLVPLRDQSRVRVGDSLFKIELFGCDETPALLEKSSRLRLLYESNVELNGIFLKDEALPELLRLLEKERRTGTLLIPFPDGSYATVVLCKGRIVNSEASERTGLRALQCLFRSSKGRSYRFTSNFEPQEAALNAWPSDILRPLESSQARGA